MRYKRPKYLGVSRLSSLKLSKCVASNHPQVVLDIEAFIQEFEQWCDSYKTSFSIKVVVEQFYTAVTLHPSHNSFTLMIERRGKEDTDKQLTFTKPRSKEKLMHEFKLRFSQVLLGGEF